MPKKFVAHCNIGHKKVYEVGSGLRNFATLDPAKEFIDDDNDVGIMSLGQAILV